MALVFKVFFLYAGRISTLLFKFTLYYLNLRLRVLNLNRKMLLFGVLFNHIFFKFENKNLDIALCINNVQGGPLKIIVIGYDA